MPEKTDSTAPSPQLSPFASLTVQNLIELVEKAGPYYFTLNETGQITAIHPRLASELGHPVEAVLGQTIQAVFTGDSGRSLENACQRVLQTRRPETVMQRQGFRNRRGEAWYELQITPLTQGLGVMFRNTTLEQDQAQIINDSERMLAAINEVNPAVIYLFNAKRKSLVFINEEMLRPLGLRPEMFDVTNGAQPENLLHPDDRAGFQQHLADLSAAPDGQKLPFEYRVQDFFGRYHWLIAQDMLFKRAADGSPEEILGSALDITEMREAEQALRLSERTFRDTFENASVGISHVSIDGRWLRVNHRLCEITGYSQEELLLMRFQDISHPDELQSDLDQYQQLIAGEINGYRIEKRYFHKNGQIIWIHLAVSLQRDEAGKPLYCISVIQDITDRKRLEAYDRFLIEMGDGLAQAGTEAEVIAITVSRLGEYLGLDRCLVAETESERQYSQVYSDYHPNLPPLEGKHPLTLQGASPFFQKALTDGKQVVVEDRQIDPRMQAIEDEKILLDQMRAFVYTPAPGEATWRGALIVGTLQPRQWQQEERQLLVSVTNLLWLTLDKVRLLMTLRQNETRFRQALDRSGLLSFRNDLNLRYTWVYNPLPAFTEIDPMGKTDAEIFPGEDGELLMALKKRVLATGQSERSEVQTRIDGRLHYYDLALEPTYDQQGQLVGIAGSVLDVTEQREAKEAIKEYTHKLEQSNQDLQDFAFIASHDLQEPLRKVKAFGDRLRDHNRGNLDAEGQDYLARMINATERMRKMIDDLLAYSRVATKAKSFTVVDLQQVAQDVLLDLEARIESTHGRVDIDALPVVHADEAQMRQLLLNLIGNALKFHRAGVHPLVRVSGYTIGQQIELHISDNGIGFDTEYLSHIFQPFTRLHGRSEYEGSGIGLAICCRIVERHGGKITAESRPDEGSTFIVTLPVAH